MHPNGGKAFWNQTNQRSHTFGKRDSPGAAGLVLLFVLVALLAGGWSRRQWPWLLSAVLLVVSQAVLGVTTLRLGLQQPLVTITHQLVAALLVGVLAALTVRSPDSSLPTRCSVVVDDTPLET